MQHVARDNRIDSLMRPSAVAVVGASAKRPSAGGNQVIRNLRASGFVGEIHVVNPAGGMIEGIEAVTSIAALPAIDVAVVCVPGQGIAPTLRELDERGCPAAVVPSAGLSERDIADVQAAVADVDMFVHGPNCMGVINVSDSVALWIDEGILMDLPVGGISLIAQSGSAAIFVARTVSAGGFARVLSTGNEYGGTTADYINWLATDDRTTVIGVVLESIRDGDAFAAAVRTADAAGKKVVVLKVGRTEAGSAATAAHTGALLASTGAYDALFESVGIVPVADYDELASSLELIATLGTRAVGRGTVGAATISGGQAALAADLAEEVRVALPAHSEQTVESLAQLLPDIHINNPLDAGGSVVAEEDSWIEALRLIAADPGIDVVVAVLDGQVTLSKIEVEYEADYFAAVAELAREYPSKPFVVASSSSVSLHETAAALFREGVPVIRGLRNALVAIRSASERVTHRDPVRPADLPDKAEVARLRTQVAAGFESDDIPRLLGRYGIPFVESARVRDVEAAEAWAERHGFPVVLKIDSPDIGHRSEVGGVCVGIQSVEGLRLAAAGILDAVSRAVPDARIVGLEIQEQLSSCHEGFVGFVSTAGLGATVAAGSGGTTIELLRDVAQSLAPIDRKAGRELIASTNLQRLADGYRNLAPVTALDEFVSVVERVSWMASDMSGLLAEADLNPVLIEHGTGRVRVVDALLVASA